MLLKIRHALVEITNPPQSKISSIIINNEIILTSGCLLQPFVQPILPLNNDIHNENVCPSTKIIRKLQNCEIINAQENTSESKFLNALNYQVTFDRRKLPASIRQQQKQMQHILTRYRVKLLYLFSCTDISRNVLKFLNASPSNSSLQHNDILHSSFLVLSLKNTREKDTFQRFITHITNYLRYLRPIEALDDVLVMCTPFGLENFYKTISIGKVSNVMTPDCCLFVVSNPLPRGCEGAAVFNNKLRLIGMIVCTSFQREQENVNMTISANFGYLLHDFMRQLGVKLNTTTLYREQSNFPWERSLVIIFCDGAQGTGTFVRVRNKKFILTCSHVVFNEPNKIYCRSINGDFLTSVLWRHPEYNRPFDVALLAAPKKTEDRDCVRLAQTKPSLGQTIYNAGFPYFVNANIKYDFNPAIFEGRIIKCAPGAIMSDACVQAGQSGGPMFDHNGSIMGVCISNIKVNELIYPNINTAVPIFNIRTALDDYAKTNDITALNNLVAKKEIRRIWSLEVPPILSKL